MSSDVNCRTSSSCVAGSAVTTSRFRSARWANPMRSRSIASSTSLLWTGLATNECAPELSARSRDSSVEITATGMWRVAASFFRRCSTRQPSMSGRNRSSVMAVGLTWSASASAATPCEVTIPLKPCSRAVSSRNRANAEVVLDDQQDVVARLDRVAVVAHLVDQPRRSLERIRAAARIDIDLDAVGRAIPGAPFDGDRFVGGRSRGRLCRPAASGRPATVGAPARAERNGT